MTMTRKEGFSVAHADHLHSLAATPGIDRDCGRCQPDISVVIPCLNEEENVLPIAKAVIGEMNKAHVSFELLFIDNGSTDKTIDLLRTMCAEDRRIRAILNNRNYGQLRSPTYGIYQASGRAVIAMCADFQDSPALLCEFIERWRMGGQIILGVRESEKTSLLLGLLRAAGYGFLQRFGDHKIIPGATGFGLYDRIVVDCLARWREPEPFFRGMLAESGFKIETIVYPRPIRIRGKSKNNILTLADFALAGIAGSSKGLLRVPIYLSILGTVPMMLTLCGALTDLIMGRSPWAFLAIMLIQLNFVLLFFFVGLMGEQVRLISERTRNVPLVIERERINFPIAPE